VRSALGCAGAGDAALAAAVRARVAGWPARSSEHARDAAAVAWWTASENAHVLALRSLPKSAELVRLTPGEVEIIDAEVERQRVIAPDGLADKVSRSSVVKGLISTLRRPSAEPAPTAPLAKSPAGEMSATEVRELMTRCFDHGLTQAQLAKLSGVERSQISRFHTQNATKPPLPPEKVRDLARAASLGIEAVTRAPAARCGGRTNMPDPEQEQFSATATIGTFVSP
jgi:hypothetical protein